jgi:hypothetical protein
MEQKKLSKDQALVCAKIFSDYFDRYENVEQYMRDQKLNSMNEKSVTLPGMGPEDDLFSDFSIHPNDMEFKLVESSADNWDKYISIISSHSNMTSIPGKNIRLAIKETKTDKWIGFIRLASPMMNMKPRNEMLGSSFISNPETAKSFNSSTIMGFVIVPAQPFGYNYLGGKLLAAICTSHEVRKIVNDKYNMNLCLFETTSLYGSSKTVSQYDGMKPYIRYKGLTESDFIPMMHGKPYDDLIKYVESLIGIFVPQDASSRKLTMQNRVIAMVKIALKGEPEYDSFIKTINNAKNLMEKKRYYISDYGFSNVEDVVMGREKELIPNKENYDKFHLDNIIKWWKNKASNRYETLKKEDRISRDIEVWTEDNQIDIIR